MAKNIEYKGFIIKSAPLILQEGGFSTNGIIEQSLSSGERDNKLNELQATIRSSEEEADDWYIEKAKTIIDQISHQ